MKLPSCMLAKPERNRRKNHSVRNKRRTKRGMVIDLDRVARIEIVQQRDQNFCQRCNAFAGEWDKDISANVVMQWAHVHTREYYITRWEPDNSLALCSRCHVWFDNHKVLGFDWFAKKFPERWERITRMLQGKSATNDAWVRSLWLERVRGSSAPRQEHGKRNVLESRSISRRSRAVGPWRGKLKNLEQKLIADLDEAEKKAWDSLGRYKFQMFGYWAAIWVHLNRIGGFRRKNPWRGLVEIAKNESMPRDYIKAFDELSGTMEGDAQELLKEIRG